MYDAGTRVWNVHNICTIVINCLFFFLVLLNIIVFECLLERVHDTNGEEIRLDIFETAFCKVRLLKFTIRRTMVVFESE